MLTVESEHRDNGPAVFLTWDVISINKDISSAEIDNLINSIEEYELFGYKQELEESYKASPWKLVSLSRVLIFWLYLNL